MWVDFKSWYTAKDLFFGVVALAQKLKIALLGLGVVGTGTISVLQRNASEITRRAGCELQVKTILVRDLAKARHCDLKDIRVTTDINDIIQDPDIDIVVEAIGGVDFAKTCIEQALLHGKHVVTANKALIATEGNHLFRIAESQGLSLSFEAAVAGGIPIIKSLREGLGANRIKEVYGIINGTSNFLLTAMQDKGMSFAKALSMAQDRGFTEADPTDDLEGIDAAHKITILASLAFGIPLQFDKVLIEGITNIDACDLWYAFELGYVLKPMGFAKKVGQGIEMRVHPTLIPEDTIMAHVDGVMNAVTVIADAVGPTLYYGQGAGSEATASAIVADLIDVSRTCLSQSLQALGRVPFLAFQSDALIDIPILPQEQMQSAYYLRMEVSDRTGALAKITKILADYEISIEAVAQKPAEERKTVPLIIVTHRTLEGKMMQARNELMRRSDILQALHQIRIEKIGNYSQSE